MKFIADESNVKVLGRTLMYDDIRYLGYSCSAVEFVFTGTKAEAVLWTDSPKYDDAGVACAAVFVNDEAEPSRRFTLHQDEDTYLLYEGTEPKQIKLRLVKYSEVQFAIIGIKSILIDGGKPPVPTAKKQRRLEFIGDSITCGYGNEGVFNVDGFKTTQENPWKAYAAITARALDADYHLVCWSGIGIISNYTEEEVPNDGWLMPPMYPCTDKATDLALGREQPRSWDYSSFLPDCIVINLGTNDASYTKGIAERVEGFGREYYDFIKCIRASNPDARILCTLGIMDQNLCPEVERQVKRLTQEGMGHIYYIAFDLQREEDGLGTDWHPSRLTHDKAAKQLEAKLREIMGW